MHATHPLSWQQQISYNSLPAIPTSAFVHQCATKRLLADTIPQKIVCTNSSPASQANHELYFALTLISRLIYQKRQTRKREKNGKVRKSIVDAAANVCMFVVRLHFTPIFCFFFGSIYSLCSVCFVHWILSFEMHVEYKIHD